ncbi:MAG: hypothetical protein Q4D43_07815, partial [Clostridia bacterium]|nr:hypothetical protein [Clostridia bacterium]
IFRCISAQTLIVCIDSRLRQHAIKKSHAEYVVQTYAECILHIFLDFRDGFLRQNRTDFLPCPNIIQKSGQVIDDDPIGDLGGFPLSRVQVFPVFIVTGKVCIEVLKDFRSPFFFIAICKCGNYFIKRIL